MKEPELTNEINLDRENLFLNQQVSVEEQNQFLDTTLGKTINTGIDLALKAILPNFIEDQIIEIKETLIREGLQAGIQQAIQSAIELGKSAMGIFTGKFDNISQVESVVKNGGLLDSISTLLNKVIDLSVQRGGLNKQVGTLIKKGKNTVLQTVNSSIENTMTNQIKSIEKINSYERNWKKFYQVKDFTQMEIAYKKMQKELTKVMPMEKILQEARKIENLHTLIKNKGGSFELTQEEIKLSEMLT